MSTASIWFYVLMGFGIAVIAAIQFVLFFLKPLIVKFVPLILLVVAWVSAHLGMWHVKIEFLANGERFIMMAVTPLALVGMAIGWGVARAVQMKRKKRAPKGRN